MMTNLGSLTMIGLVTPLMRSEDDNDELGEQN
jgi:hypothetical protein